jgi:pimeloyl-ACP methyl ester carboxylesterase
LLQRRRKILVRLLSFLVFAVVIAVALVELVCLVVALYEMLNSPENRGARLTTRALFAATGAWLCETAAAVIALLATPLGLVAWRIARSRPPAPPPIVFVPGWLMTPICFWPLRARLARAGWRVATGYRYRTVRGDVRRAAEGLRDIIETVCAESGAPHVIVIAHGIGGIVARICLRERATAARIGQLVTLGSPHRGSKLFALALDPMLQDLRPGTALVEELSAPDDAPRHTEVTAIYSSFDLAVVPASAGQYPAGSSIEIEGVGHLELLWSSRVYEIVRENLEFVRERDADDDTPDPPILPVCERG